MSKTKKHNCLVDFPREIVFNTSIEGKDAFGVLVNECTYHRISLSIEYDSGFIADPLTGNRAPELDELPTWEAIVGNYSYGRVYSIKEALGGAFSLLYSILKEEVTNHEDETATGSA